MATATSTVKFTTEQYDLMIDAGVFAHSWGADSPGVGPLRVELIAGDIMMMSPIGSRHEEIVDRLNEWSGAVVSRQVARIRIQQSLGIPGQESVPQPDVAWVQPRDYTTKRPDASDALLVIEVAETSLQYDLQEKAAVYASGGVPEYLVVDLASEVVHLFRHPASSGYAEKRVAGRGDTIAPLSQPEAGLAVESLFVRRR